MPLKYANNCVKDRHHNGIATRDRWQKCSTKVKFMPYVKAAHSTNFETRPKLSIVEALSTED